MGYETHVPFDRHQLIHEGEWKRVRVRGLSRPSVLYP